MFDASAIVTASAKQFINQSPELHQPLASIRQAIDSYFGDYQHLQIDLFTDPDDSDNRSLTITLVTSDDAMEQLKQFDRDWWFKQPYSLRQHVTITIESLRG